MKTLKIAALAAGVLFLAGCGNKTVNNTGETVQTPAPAVAQSNKNTSLVLNSIQDAMSRNVTMKCDYSLKISNERELAVTTYTKEKEYMTVMNVADKLQHTFFDGMAVYSWMDGQKQGTKITVACSEELVKNAPQGNQVMSAPDPSGEKAFNSAMNVKCVPAEGIGFSVPTDVAFVDQCERMKALIKNIPSGASVPNMPQIQK